MRSMRYVLGRKVLRVLRTVPFALQVRVGIAILSYDKDLLFGITADYDSDPTWTNWARALNPVGA